MNGDYLPPALLGPLILVSSYIDSGLVPLNPRRKSGNNFLASDSRGIRRRPLAWVDGHIEIGMNSDATRTQPICNECTKVVCSSNTIAMRRCDNIVIKLARKMLVTLLHKQLLKSHRESIAVDHPHLQFEREYNADSSLSRQ